MMMMMMMMMTMTRFAVGGSHAFVMCMMMMTMMMMMIITLRRQMCAICPFIRSLLIASHCGILGPITWPFASRFAVHRCFSIISLAIS